MKSVFLSSASRTSVDVFFAWPWLFLLALSAVTWLLPLTPAIQTLKPNPPLPFSTRDGGDDIDDNNNNADKTNTSSPGEFLITQALEAAGCDKRSFVRDLRPTEKCLNLQEILEEGFARKFGKDNSEADEDKSYLAEEFDIMPEVKADCWCPAQFESSQVAYANRECSYAMNRAIRGLDENAVFTEDLSGWQSKLGDSMKKMTQRKVYVNRKEVLTRYNTLVTKRTCFVLFVFALLTLIPSLCWEMMSALPGALRIDKTLDMLHSAQTLAADACRQVYQDVAKKTTAVAASSAKTTKTFLLCKTAAFVVSLGTAVFIFASLQPQLGRLATEMEELSEIAKLLPLKDHSVFHCFYKIRQMQNVHDYTVQCLTHFDMPSGSGTGLDRREFRSAAYYLALDQARSILGTYEALFCVVSTFLLLHTAANFLSVVKWIAMLYICRPDSLDQATQKQGCSEAMEYSEDVRFFLGMVHEQLGHVVSKEMTERFAEVTSGDLGNYSELGRAYCDIKDNI